MDATFVEIRTAAASEVAALESVQWRASLMWAEYREALLAHPEVIAVPIADIESGNVRVASGALPVLGFHSLVAGNAERAAELDALFVDPDFWRRGIGRALVQDAVQLARARGCDRIDVTANPRAVVFYEKLGFVHDGSVQTQFGHGLRMHADVG